MKTVDVDEAMPTLFQLLAEVERGVEVVIVRNGLPIAQLSAFRPPIGREPGLWRSYPGWEGFVYDPNVLAPITEKEIEGEGWA